MISPTNAQFVLTGLANELQLAQKVLLGAQTVFDKAKADLDAAASRVVILVSLNNSLIQLPEVQQAVKDLEVAQLQDLSPSGTLSVG